MRTMPSVASTPPASRRVGSAREGVRRAHRMPSIHERVLLAAVCGRCRRPSRLPPALARRVTPPTVATCGGQGGPPPLARVTRARALPCPAICLPPSSRSATGGSTSAQWALPPVTPPQVEVGTRASRGRQSPSRSRRSAVRRRSHTSDAVAANARCPRWCLVHHFAPPPPPPTPLPAQSRTASASGASQRRPPLGRSRRPARPSRRSPRLLWPAAVRG